MRSSLPALSFVSVDRFVTPQSFTDHSVNVTTNFKKNKNMTTNKQLIFGLTLLLFVLLQTAFGQSLKNIKIDNKQSILNDKAFFYFPTDAKNEDRETDIMSADLGSKPFRRQGI